MKFATRISSMRRHRLEAVQVVLGRLALDVRDSLASSALAGCTRSPSTSSTRVTGCCASQSISRPGTSAAARARSRRRARVAEPDRRGDEEGAPRPPRARLRARRMERAAPYAIGELAQQQVRPSPGSRACGPCPAPSSSTSLPFVAAASAFAARRGADRILVAVHHEHRTAHALAQRQQLVAVRLGRKHRRDQRLGSVSRPQPTQSSICFVECGSVNILEKKNSRKPR
jgi:hypothetical protein